MSDPWTAMLIAAVERVYTDSCPCAWPRMRYLLEFHFGPYNSGPALCHETEVLHQQVFRRGADWSVEQSDGGPNVLVGRRRCVHCSSLVATGWEEFSIALQLSRAQWLEVAATPAGAPLSTPAPLVRGIAGHISGYTAFERDFRRASVEELERWLRET